MSPSPRFFEVKSVPKLIYLSHPITNISISDRENRDLALAALKGAGLFVHCPGIVEPTGVSIGDCQEIDYQIMGATDAHVVVWPVRQLSVGSIAELEWARWFYRIPSYIWVPPDGIEVPVWCWATAREKVFPSLSEIIKEIIT